MSDDFAVINEPRYTEATTSISYINEAGVPEEVAQQVARSQDISSAIEKWSQSLRAGQATRSWDLFNRTAYSHTNNIFATFGACARAVESDDILSTLADTVERLAITHTKFEMRDDDQEDCWNQISDDIRLEARFREIFRELFKISQVYVGVWWESKTYTVRTKPSQDDFNIQPPLPPDPITGIVPDQPVPEKPKKKGNRQRKKQFAIQAPTAFTVFDPTKVIPVGTLMFNRERFAYCASRGEHAAFSRVFSDTDPLVDETILNMIEGRYRPSEEERHFCTANEIDPDALWLFKKGSIFRHTLTRPQYQRYADIRLKSVLEILDMKAHLRASDRSALIGATNFIVVIRKGSDKIPARQAEIENLQEQAKVVARMPILVGDHRLQVDIVTPSVDHTLDEARYNTLDNRLIFRALTGFALPKNSGGTANASGSGGSDQARIVGRGLESMRAELITTIERAVFQEAMDRNPGVLTEMPKLAFTPRTVTLDLSTDIINAMLKLRDRGDISRQTTLEEVGFDQDIEALRRSRERTVHDAVFTSIVPFSSPSATPFASGATGGRPAGTTKAQGAKPPAKKADKAELDQSDDEEEVID